MSTPESMHRFAALTLFPEMFTALTAWGVTGRALEQGLWSLSLHNPQDFATDRHATVDDRPYGGGPGMVMQAPLLDKALAAAREAVDCDCRVIALTPQGRPFNDRVAREFLADRATILVSGRYEGMDERFLEHSVDDEISVGDLSLIHI